MYVQLYIHVSTLILLLSIKAIAEGIEASILLKEETDFIEPQLLCNHTKSEIFVI